MKKIRLAYRHSIDANSSKAWDTYVFKDTYQEFLIQHQKFNNKENPTLTFRELVSQNPKAEQLHFLVGMASDGYLQQLNGKLHLVNDVLGNNYMPFEGCKLDIVNSHISDISKHKIGLTFFSTEVILLDIINNCYLISKEIGKGNSFDTLMFPMQPQLSICYYETLGA